MTKLDADSKDRILQAALAERAVLAGWLNPADIPFSLILREMCAQNSCGQYGTSWMGPPAIGPVSELAERVRAYSDGLVIQTVYQLEDSFDYPGMLEAKAEHKAVFLEILADLRQKFPAETAGLLALDAGCCNICDPCSYPGEPCRLPGEAISAVEAYGINVNGMLSLCGLKYNNGRDTVSFVGLILF